MVNQPSAADLQQVAANAASDAEVASIAEGDGTRQQLAQTFHQGRNATMSAARDLGPDVKAKLAAYTDRIGRVLAVAQGVGYAVPTPRLSHELGAYTRQHTYDTARIEQAMALADENVRQLTQDAEKEAAAIEQAAWASAIPGAPDRALSGRVASSLSAVQMALAAGQKPADILVRISGDPVAVHAMLGSQEGRQLLTVLGADIPALARQYGESVLAAGGTFPGSQFLAMQRDPATSLAALAKAARESYEAQKARAKALLNTKHVRSATGGR